MSPAVNLRSSAPPLLRCDGHPPPSASRAGVAFEAEALHTCQIRLMGCCVERSKEGGGDRRSTPGDMSATQHLIGLIPRQCERMVYLCGLPKLSAPRSAANTASGASAIRLCPLAIVTTLAFSATPKSRDALGGVI